MATKKRIEQLDNLIDWEKEGRLPNTKDLFNRRIEPDFYLREITPKNWMLEACKVEDKTLLTTKIMLSHEAFIQLVLCGLEAIKLSEE